MKISVENLGILKDAEFELGDLTLICGDNNTGKTYATYALFGFLDNWRKFLSVEIPDAAISDLLENGITRVEVTPHAMQAQAILARGCKEYVRELPRIFASRSDRFRQTNFLVSLDSDTFTSVPDRSFERRIVASHAMSGAEEDAILLLSKAEGDDHLVTSLLKTSKRDMWPVRVIQNVISDGIIELLFSRLFPRTFIASAERTGAAMFRKELDFARNRLLDEMGRSDGEFDPMDFLFKHHSDYPSPVKVNADFIRRIERIAKEDSFLVQKHQGILDEFSDIIGGVYLAESNDTIYFETKSRLKLTMGESSSAVRSLLDIGFYLRHVARKGDLLIVDEPELNLHPRNQRRIARLFARLVNLGVRVFATTHSDYIVKELNTLIMLNQEKPYLDRLAKAKGYRADELLDPTRVKVFIAERPVSEVRSKSRRARHPTLVPASIEPHLGIEARSFDETINEMNSIQEAIMWGDDE
jgi:hypothetical protein